MRIQLWILSEGDEKYFACTQVNQRIRVLLDLDGGE
jgi:hypothetical protein